MIARALRELCDAVYPRACFLCGASAVDGIACAEHRLPLELPGPRCGICSAALAPAITDGERCPRCRAKRPRFARLLVAFDYRACAAAREWILAFKHAGRADLARPLAAVLARRLAEHVDRPSELALVPAPLHSLRRLERGYDQARLLAGELALRCGARAVPALVRARATPVQGAPGSPPRRANVAGAFRADPRALAGLAGRAVWLVDDVVTSGATLDECARALRQVGVRNVRALALARASGADSAALPPAWE